VFNDFDSPWAIEIVRGAAAAAQAEGLTVAFTALSEGDEQLVQRPTTSPERARSVRPRLR
jgi:DNA-binding LacI/PurR family transcriptional regulator